MSERGAEGILRKRREDAAAAKAVTETPSSKPAGDAQHDVERTPAKRETATGRAARGAAGGAAGGPEGAVAGAVLGALSGKHGPRGGGKKALTAEFLICMVITIISPLKGGTDAAPWMRRATAIAAVYMILGFVGSIGDTARRVSNGLGLLVLLAVAVAQPDVWSNLLSAIESASGGVTSTAAQQYAAVGNRTPDQVVNDIITGDPSIQPAGSDFTSILGTQPGVVGTPSGPNVGIPGLPAGFGGNT